MIWSFALTAVGLVGLWLTGLKNRWGFAVGVLAQVMWFTYALVTQQWGFIASCILFGFLYSRNFIMWSRAAKAPKPEPEVSKPQLSRDQALQFLVEEDNGFMGKKLVFDSEKCQHCGGVHDRKCPAVSEIEYHPDGKVRKVTYFEHGAWPEDSVLWLEDIIAAATADGD